MLILLRKGPKIKVAELLTLEEQLSFSSPGRSPGRAVVLPPALALVFAHRRRY